MERYTEINSDTVQFSAPVAASHGPASREDDRALRRREDVLSAHVEGGVVVYDPVVGVAHHLVSPVAEVWAACDGALSPDEVIDRCALPADEAEAALAWLDEAGLLRRAGAALSRRKLLIGAAAFAGTAAASTILLPAAEAAASTFPVPPPSCPHLSSWCFAVWNTGPCYWYRCDETEPSTGSACVDYSGNRRNGVYNGTCTSTSGAVGCDTDPGVELVGGAKVCYTPPIAEIPSTTWALGGFFRLDSSCQASNGIALLSCGQTKTVDLSIRSVGGQACWVITTAQSGQISKFVTSPLGSCGRGLLGADGSGSSTWHFVVLSWTGSGFTVNVDGYPDAHLIPSRVTAADGGDNKAHCFGGNVATGCSYTGGVDEAICWNAAMSDTKLGVLYASSLSGGYHYG